MRVLGTDAIAGCHQRERAVVCGGSGSSRVSTLRLARLRLVKRSPMVTGWSVPDSVPSFHAMASSSPWYFRASVRIWYRQRRIC